MTTLETTLDPMARAVARPRTITVRAAAAPGALALVTAVYAFVSPGPVRIATALAVSATALIPVVLRSRPALPGWLHLGGAIGVLGFAGGGLTTDGIATGWQPLVAILAYPLLVRALLRHVAKYRLVRRSDLLVEAALIGAAVAIVLQAGIDWQSDGSAVTGIDAMSRSGLPALLVGLDVAAIVVTSWSLRIRSARRGPLGLVASGLVLLFASHALSAVRLGTGAGSGLAAEWLIALAMLAVGAAAVHAAFIHTPPSTVAEPALFSVGHAVLVVLSLLAAPTVLAVHTVNGVMVSATIATGAGLSGVVLANYLIELLRERAAGEHQATHDVLTNLPNRLLFMDRLERAIAHAERNQSPVGVLYIDLDRFKDVNDTLGHPAGDELLRVTAERLLGSTRHEDTVARLGGDEFAVLLPHLASPEDILQVADRILEALGEPVQLGGHSLRNPASIGAATFPSDGTNPETLVSSADDAMYQAKDLDGSAVVACSATTPNDAAERLETETALYAAIGNDELVLHYQPIFDAASGTVAGAEALVRWNHPEKGLLGPGQFIPVAEQSDLIVLVGSWVVAEACREQVRWAKLGFGDRFVTVNISARHFAHDVVSTMTAALRSTGADPSKIIVEVTESVAVEDVEVVAARLQELRDIGVRSAIDDFGTGYCGLQYLSDLPVDTLKIDKSFVQSMTPRSAAIVDATIAMSHSLGLRVVAEGVETSDQQRLLERQGCDRLQGYHLGRPVPADEFVERFLGGVGAVLRDPVLPRMITPTNGSADGAMPEAPTGPDVPASSGAATGTC